MTFTLFSVIVFLILGLAIFKSSMKGYSRGFINAGINLIAMVFSMVAASLLSSLWIAKNVAAEILPELDLGGEISEMSDSMGYSFDNLIEALLSMIVSAFTFVILYFIIFAVCRIVIAIIKKNVLKNDFCNLGYVGEDEPWYIRNNNKIGAIIGGISGFLIVAICLSPVVGSLKVAGRVINILDSFDVVDKRDNEACEIIENYSDDFGTTVFYYCGGKIVYDLGARTSIDGNTVILSREAKTLEAISDDAKLLVSGFKDMENVESNSFKRLKDICEEISDSYFLTSLASDLISGAAEKWRDGEEFMSVSFPMTNDTLDPMFDGVFSVFSSTKPNTVISDLVTFSDICITVIDSGLLDAGEDYDSVMAILEDGSVMNNLMRILERNSRMSFVSDMLYRTAMKTLVKTIKFDGYDVNEYENLIGNITDQFNRMQGQGDEKKVETITDYAVKYISDYGVDVPDSVAKMIVSAMVEEISPDDSGYIDPSQISEFFDKYYTSAN